VPSPESSKDPPHEPKDVPQATWPVLTFETRKAFHNLEGSSMTSHQANRSKNCFPFEVESLEGRRLLSAASPTLVTASPPSSDVVTHQNSGSRTGAHHNERTLTPLKKKQKVNQNAFLQTNLVSDIPGLAKITDSDLKNSWGVSEIATSPFWVSNQATNTSTLYSVTSAGVSKVALTVAIPQTGAGPQGPTGQVANQTTSFLLNGAPANFIFANLNGTISAWNGGNVATVEATMPGASYTGLATATNRTRGSLLYAANGAQNRIDVFDGSFVHKKLPGQAFIDPKLRKSQGLVPFNVQNVGGAIYVTYAPAGHAAQTGAKEGQGAVAVFDTAGHFIRQVVSGSKLASPWGITIAPASFGKFAGELLVGNFAFNSGEINAFNPKTGKFIGTLSNTAGTPIRNQALWYIGFGNGGSGGDRNTLHFAAGINAEADGLFGSLQPVTA
jgi:uncharacterized protein (TIGR03118 family)